MSEIIVPLAAVAVPLVGAGLVAWGNLRANMNGLRADVDEKANKEVVEMIDGRLARIEGKVDRLLERG